MKRFSFTTEGKWWVKDSRNGKRSGPWAEKDAKLLAENLNSYVLRAGEDNSLPYEAVENS